GALASDQIVLIAALALSRTQDDKGNVRWTLFGNSHAGAGAALWRAVTPDQLQRLVAWAGHHRNWGVFAGPDELPEALAQALQGRICTQSPPRGVTSLVTLQPFARLPVEVRRAFLARELVLLPHPASLVWSEHRRYRDLAKTLPRAIQIALLQLFPRV